MHTGAPLGVEWLCKILRKSYEQFSRNLKFSWKGREKKSKKKRHDCISSRKFFPTPKNDTRVVYSIKAFFSILVQHFQRWSSSVEASWETSRETFFFHFLQILATDNSTVTTAAAAAEVNATESINGTLEGQLQLNSTNVTTDGCEPGPDGSIQVGCGKVYPELGADVKAIKKSDFTFGWKYEEWVSFLESL